MGKLKLINTFDWITKLGVIFLILISFCLLYLDNYVNSSTPVIGEIVKKQCTLDSSGNPECFVFIKSEEGNTKKIDSRYIYNEITTNKKYKVFLNFFRTKALSIEEIK